MQFEEILEKKSANYILEWLQTSVESPSTLWVSLFLDVAEIRECEAKCVLFALAGVSINSAGGTTSGNRPWIQMTSILHQLTRGRWINLTKITMDHVQRLVSIVLECEPAWDTPYGGDGSDDDPDYEILDPLQDAIANGKVEHVRRLVEHGTIVPTSEDLVFAAENGYVDALEILIIAGGAHMSECQLELCPWWARLTQQRVTAVEEQIRGAIAELWLALPQTIPAEIRETIVGHVWTSRFDLASWNGEREWNIQSQRAMTVLNN